MNRSTKKLMAMILTVTVICSVFVPISAFAKTVKIAEWNINSGADSAISTDTNITYDGEKSLKLTSNQSASAGTVVAVEKGRAYTLKFMAKGNNISGNAAVSIGSKSYSLKPIANTFDWTQFSFEYEHSEESGNINISFSVSGLVSGVWIDSVKFFDNEKSKINLIPNPKFDERIDVDQVKDIEGNSLEEKYYNLKQADVFKVEDLEQVLGGFKNISVKPAKDIVIDGNGEDWQDYPIIAMPTLSTQYQIYINPDPNPRDLTAELRVAYSDTHFYFYVDVKDDIHTYQDDANYWQKDSIQFALSRISDSYGYEIGLLYNEDEDKGSIYSTAITETELHAMDFHAKRNGNVTTYEIAIPWTIYYGGSLPEDMLFDLLINENNGTGRRYCVELAPGISEGKKNDEFPLMNFISSEKDWYGWIEGERKPTINEENIYNVYLINYGDAKNFKFTYPDGMTESVSVGKNEGIRHEYKAMFEESGESILTINIDDNDSIDYSLYIMPDESKVEKYTSIFTKQLKEISTLMKKCDKQGIYYDDELAYYTIIERFIQYMNDDVQAGDMSRIDYTIEKLTELCELSISNLNAYLSGEKVSVKVPRYEVTGEDKIDGQDIIAMTDEGERPVFFIGFGHFQTAANDLPLWKNFGFNAIQFEIGPSTVLKNRGDVPYWQYEVNWADASAKVSEKEAVSGKKSLHITNSTAVQPNVFAALSQEVKVEPNTTYEIGMKIKAKNIQNFYYTFNGFNDRNFIPENVSEWTDVNATFTTGSEQTSTFFRLGIDGLTEECYIDDIYARKPGGDNLLQNGDFEAEDNGKAWIASTWHLPTTLNVLKSAKENNVALTLLLSPHYLTDGMLQAYPELATGPLHANPGYNVNSDIAREYIEDYLRLLIPLVKDEEALQSFCLANEPHLPTVSMTKFYKPKWEEFLKNKYGSIERLNDAWAGEYSRFEDVMMPTGQNYDMQYYDYIQFNDEQFNQWYVFMKNIIREYTDKPVHVKIMHNMGENDHQGVDRRYKTAFGMNPERFAEICEMNGNDAILIPNWVVSGEQGALEKSLYYDYQTSLRDAPVNNSEDHIIFDQDSTYNDFYADFTETDLWQGAVHGRTVSTIWTWERAADSTSVFNGLYLYRPDCVAAVGKTNLDLNRYAYEVKSIRDEKRDVAILYSISSRVYQTDYMNAVYKAYEATTFNGKHPLILNEENIAKLGSCDALIIPHAIHVKESAARTIYNFIQNGGKVMIVGDDSLTYTEETNTKISQEIRDYIFANSTVIPCKEDGNFMSSPTNEEFADAVENFLVDNRLQYIRLIDTATGETVSNMEWLHGIKDGKIILNINNYEVDTPKTVNIEIGSKIVETVKDIRNDVVLEKNITVEPYSPMLLEIEIDNVFVDTYKHWGEGEITALYQKGLVSGVSESRFAPDKNISRAEFLALCLRTLNVPETAYKNSFLDVSADKWYAGVVEAAKNTGLTDELVADGMLKADTPITREEMMTVLVKTYEYLGRKADGEYMEQFADIDNIGEVFAPYVQKAVSMGWVKGDNGRILPKDLSTRAEASALLNRYLESK